jgi:hypothetical protein
MIPAEETSPQDPPPVEGTLPDAPCPHCGQEGQYLFTVGVDAWFRHCGGDYSRKLVLA